MIHTGFRFTFCTRWRRSFRLLWSALLKFDKDSVRWLSSERMLIHRGSTLGIIWGMRCIPHSGLMLENDRCWYIDCSLAWKEVRIPHLLSPLNNCRRHYLDQLLIQRFILREDTSSIHSTIHILVWILNTRRRSVYGPREGTWKINECVGDELLNALLTFAAFETQINHTAFKGIHSDGKRIVGIPNMKSKDLSWRFINVSCWEVSGTAAKLSAS
jgi:hypothetical protein